MIFRKSFYSKDNGDSTVIMEHLKKGFIGKARLHPDDKSNASEIAGCRLAELRATRSALLYERKLKKEEAEACRRMVKACMNTKKFDKTSDSAKVLFHQLNLRIKAVNNLADEINDIDKEIESLIKQRDIIVKALQRKKYNPPISIVNDNEE